jgi:hypothetical protein
VLRTPTGSPAGMRVVFCDVDPFNLWVWAQLKSNASTAEKELLEEVLKAWFIVGKLGGFNAMRLTVQRHANEVATSVSNMPYDADDRDNSAALFHAMGDCEFKDNWMRCWCARAAVLRACVSDALTRRAWSRRQVRPGHLGRACARRAHQQPQHVQQRVRFFCGRWSCGRTLCVA